MVENFFYSLNSQLIVNSNFYFCNIFQTVSSHDFTQDSLYDPKCKTIAKGGNTIENIERTFDIHPFAYVSSSSSNSTENLAKEAGTFHKKGRLVYFSVLSTFCLICRALLHSTYIRY